MENLIAADRNQYGDIISFKTSSGRIISFRKAVEEMQSGVLSVGEGEAELDQGNQFDAVNLGDQVFNDLPSIY